MPSYLDSIGLAYLWSKISMEDYPNNETLIAILNAIDSTKVDKKDLVNYLTKEEYIAGESGGTIDLNHLLSKEEAQQTYATLEKVYPIGSIYMSINNTSPAALFGFGTWELIPDMFLLGAGGDFNGGDTGGERTHILTTTEMPAHTHTYLRHQFDRNDTTGETGADVYGANNKTLPQVNATTESTGNSVAHNNMPPYLAVYIWKRMG